jgi:hypothetical protein
MNRRNFLAVSGGSLAMSMPANAAETKNKLIEMRLIKMRNTTDGMVQRTNDYLSKGLVPALGRAGVTPVGVFNSVIAADSPFVLLVTQYDGFAAYEEADRKLRADKELASAGAAMASGPLPFTRMEVTLLRGFDTMPGIEVPAALPDKKSRIFEIRTYESNHGISLRRKIRMFDEGEIALFRKLDITPVFFGETIAGRNMPNLTYMVAFNDLAQREKAWGAFGSSPEWQKMRSQPGVSDGEIVSNITNSIVRPANFSGIR